MSSYDMIQAVTVIRYNAIKQVIYIDFRVETLPPFSRLQADSEILVSKKVAHF